MPIIDNLKIYYKIASGREIIISYYDTINFIFYTILKIKINGGDYIALCSLSYLLNIDATTCLTGNNDVVSAHLNMLSNNDIYNLIPIDNLNTSSIIDIHNKMVCEELAYRRFSKIKKYLVV